jgi:CheY-like chemotaxis protein
MDQNTTNTTAQTNGQPDALDPVMPQPSTVVSPATQPPVVSGPQDSNVVAESQSSQAPASPEPQPANIQPQTETASQATSTNSGAKRILLVEDDDALASVYQTRLQAEGFEMRRVPNGEEALAAALQYHPDLILLDVMMPRVSGFDVLDILRNTPETTNVKVVMLTALSQDSDKERAMSLGVDEYLVKSQVVIADVVSRIKHHLGLA